MTMIGRVSVALGTFALVVGLHFAWNGPGPVESCAAPTAVACSASSCSVPETHWERYLREGLHYLAFSYGLSLAFAVWVLSGISSLGRGRSLGLATGGLTWTGVLVATGCGLLGCCGPPLLPALASVFGLAGLGVAPRGVAVITMLGVAMGAVWLRSGRQDFGPCLACPDTPTETIRADP